MSYKMMTLKFFIIGVFAIEIVRCLNPSDADVSEGPCIAATAASNFDANWFFNPRMWTPSGGNKYLLYRISAGFPEFSNLRKFEVYYYACPQAFFDLPGENITAYAFGQNIGSYNFDVIGPGVIEFWAKPPVPGAGEKFISTITLTDNKTFAFLAKCFTGQNQRGWDLFTINPQIVTPQFQKKIEDHAVSLGFNREHFAFYRYKNCKHLFSDGIVLGGDQSRAFACKNFM